MTEETLRAEISFLKAVAAEGGRPFARDGAALVATGTVWGLGSLMGWAYLHGLPLPREAMQGMLYATLPLILLSAFLLRRNLPRQPAGAASRGISAAWSALASTFVATLIALFVAAVQLRNPAIVMLVTTVMFALYGAGWWVAYFVMRRPSHAAIAAGCFVLTIVTGALIGSHDLWLAHGLGMLMLVALPGLMIMREATAGSIE